MPQKNGGLESVMYVDDSSNIQSDIQNKIFGETTITSPNSVLRINLIPEPTLSSYMNLWAPGTCDLVYPTTNSSQTTCKPFTTTLDSTASISSFLKTYASGHRSYFVTNSDESLMVPVYMPHTKCNNINPGDPCYLGGSSSVALPYLNKIDNTVYPGPNYYAALIHKWNASKRGFIFPISQGGINSILLATPGNLIPNKLSGFNFQQDNNQLIYIPISSAEKVIRTDFGSDFIGYMVTNIGYDSFSSLKLSCNVFNFANDGANAPSSQVAVPSVNYCMNINNIEYNPHYFEDIRSKDNEIRQYLYNLISCSGVSGSSNSTQYGCMTPTYLPNYYKDLDFSNNIANYYMYSFLGPELCSDGICAPTYPDAKWSNIMAFADYSSTIQSLRNSALESYKSTNEPALVLDNKYKNSEYTVSFFSNCVNNTNSFTIDFKTFINSSDLSKAKGELTYFNCILDGNSLGNSCGLVAFGFLDGFPYSALKPIYYGEVLPNTFSFNKIYLTNNYFPNLGGYKSQSNIPAGNCAVAEPSINSVGGLQFIFVPTGVCGLKSSSGGNGMSESSSNKNSGVDSSDNSFLFVEPGE